MAITTDKATAAWVVKGSVEWTHDQTDTDATPCKVVWPPS